MRERLLIGRYVERDSWIHKLDPRSKTIGMALFMIAVFLVDSYLAAAALFVFALAIMRSSRISLLLFAKATKPLLFLVLFIFLFHLLFESGGVQLIDVGPFALYAGGLEKGIVSAARMLIFIMFAMLLTFTTQPDRLAQGLQDLLRPLRAVGLPIDRFVLMLQIALRFVPTIFEEAERLWKAQQSRGMDLRGRPLREKTRLIIALLVPITVGTFRRAIGLADSMEARGYRIGELRTAYRQLTWARSDTLFLLCFVLPLAVVAIW